MAEKLVMLALSPTMEMGTIARWLKNEGDTVSSGDIVCEVETDKATMEYETVQEGTLLKIVAGNGSKTKVGQPIGILGAPGEDISAVLGQLASEPAPAQGVVSTPEPFETSTAAPPDAPPAPTPGIGGHGVAASPLARKLAKERGLDIARIQGSGPAGRVVKKDILSAGTAKLAQTGQSAPVKGSDTVITVSQKRHIIATRLAQSLFTAPHYYLRNPIAVEALLNLRQDINRDRETKLSLNAFLIKCTAAALAHHPMVNASWHETTIVQHGSIDIALAVAQEDGLITPVVRDCASKGIEQIDSELKELIALARENKLSPEQYTGSTFTISNLGAAGIREFTAIINPPEAAILAVGETYAQVVAGSDGQVHTQQTMVLTLSVDHRILDGAVAAAFFAQLKQILENPARALL